MGSIPGVCSLDAVFYVIVSCTAFVALRHFSWTFFAFPFFLPLFWQDQRPTFEHLLLPRTTGFGACVEAFSKAQNPDRMEALQRERGYYNRVVYDFTVNRTLVGGRRFFHYVVISNFQSFCLSIFVGFLCLFFFKVVIRFPSRFTLLSLLEVLHSLQTSCLCKSVCLLKYRKPRNPFM